MTPYSLLFKPIYKEQVCCGRELVRLGKQLPEGVSIGESWELADLPESIAGGRSVIANGELAGITLRQALEQHEKMILGAAKPTPGGGFPLLIKYLDARENLSVQVHPDEVYIRNHPETHLKSEAWYIIDAEPGAVIYRGIDPAVSREQFARHIETDNVIDDLIAIPVKSGDCHYLPSGTCHALGAGIVIAEIQTPSDTTFRVHDWGRTDRELHIEAALECIHFGLHAGNDSLDANENAHQPQIRPIEVKGVSSTPLVISDHFEIEVIRVEASGNLGIVTNGMPIIWMLIEGSAEIESDETASIPLRKGDTVLHPAGLENVHARFPEQSMLLQILLPSPLKGLIA